MDRFARSHWTRPWSAMTSKLLPFVLATALLAACQPEQGSVAASAAAAPAAAIADPMPTTPASAAVAPASGDATPAQASSLRAALTVLAAAQPPSWAQVKAIPGLGELAPADGVRIYPVAVRGKTTLAGFGEAPLPDGKVGADAGTRTGNEGEASVTFAGDVATALLLVVRKFYPSTDYAKVLRAQLRAGDRVVRRDGVCDDSIPSPAPAAMEYWVALEGAERPLAVTASTVDGGNNGPGYTDFEFRRGGANVALAQCAQ
ncbi:hypothetical protein [Xanthomonas bonasiae]|uniref:hypothetical protein n=1 Tax=Xanthomonas bonasiae TaxID=2810351 RepID=UPI0019818B59|nr:hypothetical protein [Xanthomonas bonasiae]MBN6110936.1 hypothetical protein [Xanthomonas bonasiae]